MAALRLVGRMKRDWMAQGRRPSGLCGAGSKQLRQNKSGITISLVVIYGHHIICGTVAFTLSGIILFVSTSGRCKDS